MTPAEQAAFVDAFGSNVSGIDDAIVADFVRRYSTGEDIEYSSDYTPIMDALGMWNYAIRWHMEQSQHHPECPALDGFGCRCEEINK